MNINKPEAIPSIKYTTKEDLRALLDQKDEELSNLQQRYYQLDHAKDTLQEKLYESGVDHRPTIMDKILERESTAWQTIKYIFKECEKETGRDFPWDAWL